MEIERNGVIIEVASESNEDVVRALLLVTSDENRSARERFDAFFALCDPKLDSLIGKDELEKIADKLCSCST